jgi:tRNA threonylcarbamoyladenosine biosynthesis protein TsaB
VRQLVIDTATGACSVALFENTMLLDGRHDIIGRGHAERLVPMLSELPDKGRADSIHVNIGPGSFTGIRVGVAAARALALAWQVECHGYGCLEMIAAIAKLSYGNAITVDVAIKGGHGEYFVQSFTESGVAIAPAISIIPEEAAQLLSANIVAGDAAQHICELRGFGNAIEIGPDARQFEAIPTLIQYPASPAYVRGPDAKLPQKRST